MEKRNLLILFLAAILLLPACKKETIVNDTTGKTEESKSDILVTSFNLAMDLQGCTSEYAGEILTNRGWAAVYNVTYDEYCDDNYYAMINDAYLSVNLEYAQSGLVCRAEVEIEYDYGLSPYDNTNYKNLIEMLGNSYLLCEGDTCQFFVAVYDDGENEITTFDYSEFVNNIDAFVQSNGSCIWWNSENYSIYFERDDEEDDYCEFRILVSNSLENGTVL